MDSWFFFVVVILDGIKKGILINVYILFFIWNVFMVCSSVWNYESDNI